MDYSFFMLTCKKGANIEKFGLTRKNRRRKQKRKSLSIKTVVSLLIVVILTE